MIKILIGLLFLISVNVMAYGDGAQTTIQGLYKGVTGNDENCFLLIHTRQNSKFLLTHLIISNDRPSDLKVGSDGDFSLMNEDFENDLLNPISDNDHLPFYENGEFSLKLNLGQKLRPVSYEFYTANELTFSCYDLDKVVY